MAIAAGIAVANIYYNQPMLGVIERAFPDSPGTGLIPTATQLGYAAGLVLLVPLGDLMDRRRLIVVQFTILALALIGSALAPTDGALIVASALLGASATVAQQIIPFAASLAAPAERGRTIGTVMSGLLCGILLSRTLAGFVAAHFGWQEMFWLGAPLALFAAGLMATFLPRNHPHADVRYGAALISLAYLWRKEPRLRGATKAQAALFASFTAFWTILALHLQEPTFHLGADIAGLFGIVGAVGVLTAPVAGRLADRRGPHLAIGIGAALTLASWLIFGLWDRVPGLVIGVVVLDLGVQSALVSHQHVVFALRPEARNRLNTIFMTGMFLGGAIGSAGATLAWQLGAWNGVCAFGAIAAILAIALRIGQRSDRNWSNLPKPSRG
jgi:predicted MFS family arabinose efflux permease